MKIVIDHGKLVIDHGKLLTGFMIDGIASLNTLTTHGTTGYFDMSIK